METKEYRVSWSIDVDATSPEAAAEIASNMLFDHDGRTDNDVFEVRPHGGDVTLVEVDRTGPATKWEGG